jgi:hypothetical protein
MVEWHAAQHLSASLMELLLARFVIPTAWSTCVQKFLCGIPKIITLSTIKAIILLIPQRGVFV